jgi:hypothetical protein
MDITAAFVPVSAPGPAAAGSAALGIGNQRRTDTQRAQVLAAAQQGQERAHPAPSDAIELRASGDDAPALLAGGAEPTRSPTPAVPFAAAAATPGVRLPACTARPAGPAGVVKPALMSAAALLDAEAADARGIGAPLSMQSKHATAVTQPDVRPPLLLASQSQAVEPPVAFQEHYMAPAAVIRLQPANTRPGGAPGGEPRAVVRCAAVAGTAAALSASPATVTSTLSAVGGTAVATGGVASPRSLQPIGRVAHEAGRWTEKRSAAAREATRTGEQEAGREGGGPDDGEGEGELQALPGESSFLDFLDGLEAELDGAGGLNAAQAAGEGSKPAAVLEAERGANIGSGGINTYGEGAPTARPVVTLFAPQPVAAPFPWRQAGANFHPQHQVGKESTSVGAYAMGASTSSVAALSSEVVDTGASSLSSSRLGLSRHSLPLPGPSSMLLPRRPPPAVPTRSDAVDSVARE